MNVVVPFVRQAMAEPERTALALGARTVTYGALLTKVKQFVVRFAAAGVGRGDNVGVVSGPVGYVAATLALAWVGAVSVELQGERAEIAGIAKRLGLKFLFHSGTDGYGLDHPGFKGELPLRAATAGTARVPGIAGVGPREPWRIALSSGTTGHPKGILYSHEGSLVNVNLLRTVYPVAADDRVLIGMNVAMAFAVHNWMRCLTVGACAVLIELPESESMLKILHNERITHALVGPASASGIAALASADGSRHGKPPPDLRAFSVGGARVSAQLQDLLRRHVCPQAYFHYGATETHLIAVLDAAIRERYPNSSGRLLPWMEVQAVDADDHPLPPGTPGRLRLRSPALALGYVGATEEADLRAFRDGWFYSSDVGRVSMSGIVRVQGRVNDVLNIGGAKVDPAALEDAIQQDPAITECSVVDVSDALGQPVLAVLVVTAAEELDVEGMKQRCVKLSPNCAPRLILRAEKLPRNASGKIIRAAVRRAVKASPEAAALRT